MGENTQLLIDKKEINTAILAGKTEAPPILAVQNQPSPDEGAKDEKEGEFTSAGKRAHNEFTYRVVDWLVNSAIGVASAYAAARTEMGRKWFTKPVTGFFEKILSPVLKGNSLNEGAKWGTTFTSIMAGGTAIIPALMVLENKENKKGIIKWLDEKWYGKEVVAADPKFEESYKAIDEEPKKGFMIGMASRLLAIAPLITLASIPATNKPLIKYIYDPIATGSKWLAKKVGFKPSQHMLDPMKGAMEHIEGDPNIPMKMQSNWDYLHRLIGFDFGLTIFYSVLHEMAYKSLSVIGVKETQDDAEVSGTKPKHVASAEAGIAPPSSLATEVDLLESSFYKKAPASHRKISGDIIPRSKTIETPASLHVDKISATESPSLARA